MNEITDRRESYFRKSAHERSADALTFLARYFAGLRVIDRVTAGKPIPAPNVVKLRRKLA